MTTDGLIATCLINGWSYRLWSSTTTYDGVVYHAHDSRHSEAGFPDLIMLRGSRCVAVECKSARGRLSREQRVWLNAFRETDVEAYVVFPWDQDWFIAEVLA